MTVEVNLAELEITVEKSQTTNLVNQCTAQMCIVRVFLIREKPSFDQTIVVGNHLIHITEYDTRITTQLGHRSTLFTLP
jgi:hypothetical protein